MCSKVKFTLSIDLLDVVTQSISNHFYLPQKHIIIIILQVIFLKDEVKIVGISTVGTMEIFKPIYSITTNH